MKLYSDRELGIEPRWFTGKQWSEGIAQAELRRDYKARVLLAEKESRKPKKKTKEPEFMRVDPNCEEVRAVKTGPHGQCQKMLEIMRRGNG